MVKSHGGLYQTLEILLLLSRRCSPHIFQDFMGFEKLAAIEQGNSLSQLGTIHALDCYMPAREKEKPRAVARGSRQLPDYRPKIP